MAEFVGTGGAQFDIEVPPGGTEARKILDAKIEAGVLKPVEKPVKVPAKKPAPTAPRE